MAVPIAKNRVPKIQTSYEAPTQSAGPVFSGKDIPPGIKNDQGLLSRVPGSFWLQVLLSRA